MRVSPRRRRWIVVFLIGTTACSARPTSLPPPVDVEIGLAVCRDARSSHECARSIEVTRMKAAGGLVVRDGARLCFRTLSPEVCIADRGSGEGEEDALFSYLGTLSRPAYHVVSVQYYEGSAMLLVHATTGASQMVDGVPVASPDGRFVAVASADLGAAYNPNRLSVWVVAGDSLARVWSLEPEGWMPGAVRWIGSTKFEVQRIAFDSDAGRERVIDTATIERRGNTWHLALEDSR